MDPHGFSTTVYFQYGRTISYGSRTPNQTKTGNNYQNVFANISGLIAGSAQLEMTRPTPQTVSNVQQHSIQGFKLYTQAHCSF